MGKHSKLKSTNSRKIIIGIITIIVILIVVYLGLSMYFVDHFYFGSSIDSVNISGDTVVQANAKIESKFDGYKLKVEGRDGLNVELTNNDIGLNYNQNEVMKLKNRQNPFKWGIEIFNSNDTKISVSKSYDKELLNKTLNNTFYGNKYKVISPKNASFKYVDGKYEVVKEVYGNKLNKDKVTDAILNAIENGEKQINLENLNCYENPTYLSNSPKVIEAQNELNKYVSSKITYDIGDNKIVVDGSTIHKWLSVNKDMNVVVSNQLVTDFVNSLAAKYNTVGKTRTFKTSLGTTATVSGGDFGWKINVPEEVQTLISEIKEGKQIERKPIYSQKGLPYGTVGLGNTYVEVNLSTQHMWYYKDGKLIVQSDVVTGNVSKNDATPQGVYYIKYKEANTHLKGKDYDTPVKFWMPFNGGIGLHDAWWRDKFGKDIYKTSGSHGCVNLPPQVAQTVFDNITPGTIVVCYN
ncbi:L,D-transpeptidase family protein [Clostridium thermobutyricum]|uniref:L,D-transpeptidase family protein n=1 Tax=Clostridium thermobutyricum TaxID=29372 RepID=UPI003F51E813